VAADGERDVRRLLPLLLLALVLAGCGLGSGGASSSGGGAQLTVSRNFGAQELGHSDRKTIPGGETVMRQLQRRFTVKTRYGGGFVQKIDGLAGGRRSGRPVDWFFYVNGIESESGAAARRLSPGDRVWWDHHDWGEAMRIPAVVGSFPEPFTSAARGRKIPVRIDCAEDALRDCREVRERLEAAGATVGGTGTLGTRAGPGVLRLLVGRWAEVRVDPTARRIEQGPKVSGVFARPAADGRRLALLDPRGQAVQTLGDGSGLVAATRFLDQQPTWVVTGTDQVGVASAAAALVEGRLKDHFAVALRNGHEVPLPAEGAGAP
jgi:Domain of unknown function (DUF4430)